MIRIVHEHPVGEEHITFGVRFDRNGPEIIRPLDQFFAFAANGHSVFANAMSFDGVLVPDGDKNRIFKVSGETGPRRVQQVAGGFPGSADVGQGARQVAVPTLERMVAAAAVHVAVSVVATTDDMDQPVGPARVGIIVDAQQPSGTIELDLDGVPKPRRELFDLGSIATATNDAAAVTVAFHATTIGTFELIRRRTHVAPGQVHPSVAIERDAQQAIVRVVGTGFHTCDQFVAVADTIVVLVRQRQHIFWPRQRAGSHRVRTPGSSPCGCRRRTR